MKTDSKRKVFFDKVKMFFKKIWPTIKNVLASIGGILLLGLIMQAIGLL